MQIVQTIRVLLMEFMEAKKGTPQVFTWLVSVDVDHQEGVIILNSKEFLACLSAFLWKHMSEDIGFGSWIDDTYLVLQVRAIVFYAPFGMFRIHHRNVDTPHVSERFPIEDIAIKRTIGNRKQARAFLACLTQENKHIVIGAEVTHIEEDITIPID